MSYSKNKIIAISILTLAIAFIIYKIVKTVSNKATTDEFYVLDLNPGDLYIMSEKAVGTDWKKKIIPTLRHATAVDEKLLKIKKDEKIDDKIVKKKKIIIDDSDDDD